jgi:hypothetical protein
LLELNEVEGAQDDLGIMPALAQPVEHGEAAGEADPAGFLLSSVTTY